MSQSRTLCIGMDVHKETLAVADVAHDHGAAGPFRGTGGTRPCALDPLLRQMPSQATPLVLGSEAGPGGAGLARALTHQGSACWGMAPSLRPTKAGARAQRTAATPCTWPA